MKNGKLFFSAVIIATGLAAGTAFGEDSVISREELSLDNYCHLTFPAIADDSLGTDHPVLKSRDSGDVIDFYGTCDEKPAGADQLREQIHEDWLQKQLLG